MQWWADIWYGVGSFFGFDRVEWGNAAEWFGSVASGAALIVAVVVFAEGQYRDSRAGADGFHTSLWSSKSPLNQTGLPNELVVDAKNLGGTPIWMPSVLVRRNGNLKGYYQIPLHPTDRPMFPSGYTSQYGISVAFAGVSRSQTFVRFRDGRNRWWIREVDSGKYIRGLRKWWLSRQFRHIEFTSDRIREIVAMGASS